MKKKRGSGESNGRENIELCDENVLSLLLFSIFVIENQKKNINIQHHHQLLTYTGFQPPRNLVPKKRTFCNAEMNGFCKKSSFNQFFQNK